MSEKRNISKAFITKNINGKEVKIFYDETIKKGVRFLKDSNGNFIAQPVKLEKEEYFKLRDLVNNSSSNTNTNTTNTTKNSVEKELVKGEDFFPYKKCEEMIKTKYPNLNSAQLETYTRKLYEDLALEYISPKLDKELGDNKKVKDVVLNIVKNTPLLAKTNIDGLLNDIIETYNIQKSEVLLDKRYLMLFPYALEVDNPNSELEAQINYKAEAYTSLFNGMITTRLLSANQISSYSSNGIPQIKRGVDSDNKNYEVVEITIMGRTGLVQPKLLNQPLSMVYNKDTDMTSYYYKVSDIYKYFAREFSDGYKKTLLNNDNKQFNEDGSLAFIEKRKVSVNDTWTHYPQIMITKTAIKDFIRNIQSFDLATLWNMDKEKINIALQRFKKLSLYDSAVLRSKKDDDGNYVRDKDNKIVLEYFYVDNRERKGEISLNSIKDGNSSIENQINDLSVGDSIKNVSKGFTTTLSNEKTNHLKDTISKIKVEDTTNIR